MHFKADRWTAIDKRWNRMFRSTHIFALKTKYYNIYMHDHNTKNAHEWSTCRAWGRNSQFGLLYSYRKHGKVSLWDNLMLCVSSCIISFQLRLDWKKNYSWKVYWCLKMWSPYDDVVIRSETAADPIFLLINSVNVVQISAEYPLIQL